ncbi:hypothetical protein KO481_40865 [Nocardia sp. NEAU-G5]|uniref:Transposase IS116/IS110/IS902 family protein n=1 Tax=Nocardia albiluteola TaxID=2842303 RepID=A0ABS6BC37_9NOCA|nr:hypothetical protein [Nocardia albiluteola]MBU3067854.1 hypothetical protein [Nocardia albiluteola]
MHSFEHAVIAALDDRAGVLGHRCGALERIELLLGDWADNKRRLADTEARMVGILDELQLTELVTSIVGLSAVSAAAILAETGDPNRFGHDLGRRLNRSASSERSGRAPLGIETPTGDLVAHHGQPRPVVSITRLHAAGNHPDYHYAGQATDQGTDPNRLTQNVLR